MREYLRAWSYHRWRSTVAAARWGTRILVPEGAREIGFGSLDRLFGAGVFVRLYFLAFLAVPVLVAGSLAWALDGGSDLQRGIYAIMLGYNAPSIVSSLSIALALTLLALAVLTYLKSLRVRLNVRRVFLTVVSWSGYGTAAGLMSVAVLPIMIKIMPSGYGPHVGGTSTLSPQLLIDVPAAGAIIGYSFGIIAAAVEVCQHARAIPVRRLVAPALLFLFVCGMSRLDAGPSGILHAMVGSVSNTPWMGCRDDAFRAHLNDPAWVFHALEACTPDGGVVMADSFFVPTLGILCAMGAIYASVRDFRHAAAQDRMDWMPASAEQTSS